MGDNNANGNIRLKCTEQSIPEFPNLLFGNHQESDRLFFDATHFLQESNSEVSVAAFLSEFKKPIIILCSSHGISPSDVCKVNEFGHYLIDGHLCYLFLSFVEPDFLAYMFDRMNELFSDGVVLSDSFIARQSRERLPREFLQKLADYDEDAVE